MLACIETLLFAAPDLAPVESLAEVARLPHIRFRDISQASPLPLVADNETVELMVNTIFHASNSEGLLQAL